MSNSRYILMGPLAPPISGQSQAFERLCGFFSKARLPFEVVDLGIHHTDRWAGHFSFVRGFEVIRSVFRLSQRLISRGVKKVYLPVAISTVGFFRDFIYIWLVRFAGGRLALQLHGGGYAEWYHRQPAWLQMIIRSTLRQAHCLIVLSESLRNEFAFLGSVSPQIRVIPNCTGADLPTWLRSEARKPGRPFRVLYLSNMLVSKGYWIAFEAVRNLVQRGYPVCIDFCGEFINDPDADHPDVEENKQKFLEILSSPDVNSWAFYHGVVRGNEKTTRLLESDVLVLPTCYAYEGQPIAIIEALACRKPVISTHYRGIPDMVGDGINGILIRPEAHELIRALETLLKSPEICVQMGAAAGEIYESRFSPQIVGTRLIAAISGDPDPRGPASI